MLKTKDFQHLIGLNIFQHPSGVVMIQQISNEKCKEKNLSIPLKSFLNTTNPEIIRIINLLISLIQTEMEK